MLSPSYSISPKDLWNAIATRDATQLVDVRRRDAYEQSLHLLPGAVWRDATKTKHWTAEFDPTRPIVAACKAGHEMSQTAVAQLRADGVDARVLEGGYEGWAKCRPAVGRQIGTRTAYAKTAGRLGDAPATENRSHRLPLADLPFSGSAGADSVCRPGPGGQRRARKRRRAV